MKVIVLAAGYGTRLEKDLCNDQSLKYNYLIGMPKCLLPIGGLPLLTHWMKIFEASGYIDHVYLGTNAKYYQQFKNWADDKSNVSVVSDQTESNETRMGAVGCLQFVKKHFNIENQNILVVAGDTLFFEDFDLKNMLDCFYELTKKENDCSLVPVYICAEKDTIKHGILEITETKVTKFLEKPQPNETNSRNACPAFYLLSREALKYVDIFLEENRDSPLSKKDAPGHFLKFLCNRLPIFAYPLSGRFDVGNLISYETCNDYFHKHPRH